MALPLRQESVATTDEIVDQLRRSLDLPVQALKQAVERADEIEPLIIDLLNRAADGHYLIPRHSNLLFWGLHAVAAARRTGIYRPLLRLLRYGSPTQVDWLLGDCVTRTVAKVIISVFDGDPIPLAEACAASDVDEYVRWSLMKAFARLTFDGRIDRAFTLEFMERFAREPLAPPGNNAWEGWHDMIILLGAESTRETMRATWDDGRNPVEDSERGHIETAITLAQSLAPDDPAMFVREHAEALQDLAKELSWSQTRERRDAEQDRYGVDPAGALALSNPEIGWLSEFVHSPKVPAGAMTLEQLDGFFCALLAGPGGIGLNECLPLIWGEDNVPTGSPEYDDIEQAQYVQGLLARHWTTIDLQLNASYPHDLVFTEHYYDYRAPGRQMAQGRHWAGGFLRGVALQAKEWRVRFGEDNIGMFAKAMVSLGMDVDAAKKEGLTSSLREQLVKVLPLRLVALHHAWRGREDPFPPTTRVAPDHKVGRNEPCPCGSGKKYKRCCGNPAKSIN